MTSKNDKLRGLFLAALMVLSITVGSIAFAGSAAAANVSDDANFDDRDDKLVSGQTFWQGQDLYLGNDTENIDQTSTLEVHPVTDDEEDTLSLVNQFSLNENGTYSLDTSGLDTGTYVITEGNNVTEFDQGNVSDTYTENSTTISMAAFDIATQSFSADFQDVDDDPVNEVDDSGPDATEYINFDSNRAEFDVIVTSDDLSEESEFEEIFNRSADWSTDWVESDEEYTLEGVNDAKYDVNFTDVETGTYDFDFEVVDTEVTDSDSIDVVEADEGDVGFVDSSVDVGQGGVAEITLELTDTDTGKLLIGDWDDDGFQLNVSVEDDSDDQVTVYFNAYEAANSSINENKEFSGYENNTIVWVDTDEESDDALVDATFKKNVSSVLDAGNYELATHTETFDKAQDSPDNVGSLYISESSVNSMNTWVSSYDNIDDVEEFSELQTAIEDGKITESSSIAAGDLIDAGEGDMLVTQIDASGIDGLMRTVENDYDAEDGTITADAFQRALTEYNESDASDTLAQGNATTGLSLWFEEQNPGANQDETTMDLKDVGDDNVDVYFDGESNYYVIVSTSDLIAEEEVGEVEDDETYTTEFDLKDNFLLDYDAGDWDDTDTDNYQTVTTDLTFVEPEMSFTMSEIDGTDYVTVEAAAEQAISGTTNVAPGTELDLRATGEDEARFVFQKSDVVVEDDGTFSADFDFSERAAEEEFEAEASTGLFDDMADNLEDGLIMEAQPEETTMEPTPTTTEEPEPTTTEPTPTTTEEPEPTTTEAPVDTTTEAPPETTTETPGFTMGLALVALLGAALLALRRKD